ncbi:MAG TPA: hypothetical protein VIQ30_10585 [Pseudonocardia sp.]
MRDILADIADVGSELADPHQHTERIEGWSTSRHRTVRRHTVTLPGLLTQLYESVYPAGSDATTRQPPSSRPPLALEALSTHAVISIAVIKWLWDLRIDQRDSVQGNIRALVGAAGLMSSDDQRRLLADLRRWRTWCAVMTGWERVEHFPEIECPVCGKVGTLRVNYTSERGYCTNQARDSDGELVCGSVWTMQDSSLMVLGRHIAAVRAAQEQAKREGAAA